MADIEVIDKSIPSSLRPIAPFLEEAQAVVRNFTMSDHKKNVAIYCIDHAFHLVEKFELTLDDVGRQVLEEFLDLRSNIASELTEPAKEAPRMPPPRAQKYYHFTLPSHL